MIIVLVAFSASAGAKLSALDLKQIFVELRASAKLGHSKNQIGH
jgi:hypothetical protein